MLLPRRPPLSLAADEVHLWDARIGAFAERESEFASLLDDEERQRAARFRFAPDRTQYVVSHGLARTALARYAGTGPHELRFEIGCFGKPALHNRASRDDRIAPTLEFNLSHAGAFMMLAVCAGSPVGVDVERWDTRIDYTELAEFCFSPAERCELTTLAADERARAFFAGWTLKEAYIKATGVGVAFGLDYFDVALRPSGGSRLLADRRTRGAPERWCVRSIPVEPGYSAALAALTATPRLCRFSLSPQALAQADDQRR